MAYASLNSSLVARKGEARPSATRLQVAGQEKRPEASFQPYASEGQLDSVDFMGPVTRRSEQAKTNLDTDFLERHASSKAIRSLETLVREKFSAPYAHQELNKLTIRADKRLLEAFKLQSALTGKTQQELFRQALEKFIASGEWITDID